MARRIKGLRRHGAGYQTFCRVNGEFRCESWPLDTPESEMTAWLRDRRAEKTPTAVVGRGVFDRDAALYLEKVTALASYADRVADIGLWIAIFRGRRRRSITSAEIRGHRDAWLKDGYAASTVNHRLRALSNLWTVLDGRRAPNPVRDVDEAHEPDGEPRAVPFALLRRILGAITDVGLAVKGERRTKPSKTKARLAVMMWAGLTQSEIGRLRRRDWDEVAGTLYVQGRRKGQGGASRTIPLSLEARRALRAFDDAEAWGAFERSAFYASFRRACRAVAADQTLPDETRVILAELRPYDVRHSHATMLYAASGDAHAAATVLGHRSTVTTARYIKAAVAERTRLAVDSFERATRTRRARSSGRIEHVPSKHGAAGSSPAGRTISRKVASDRRQRAKRPAEAAQK
jgi:integrase